MRLHSLTSRFLVTLVVSTSLPFAVFAAFVISGMRERLEGQLVSVFLPDKAAGAARTIDDQIGRIDQACQTAQILAREALRTGGPGETTADVHERRDRFEELIDFVPGLLGQYADLVLLADSEGKVFEFFLGRGLPRSEQAFREQLIPRNVAEEDWFVRMRGDTTLGKLWLPWSRSPYLHRNPDPVSRDPSDYNIGVVYRVGSGSFDGALLVLIRCAELQKTLDDAQEFLRGTDGAGFDSAQVFLMDDSGVALAHTDRAQTRAELPGALVREVRQTTDRGQYEIGADGSPAQVAAFARMQPLTDEGGWWVGILADSDEVFATSRNFQRVLIATVIVSGIILALWSLFASRAILRPVRRLVTATKEVARGELSARVPAKGQDELSELGRAFNVMTEELTASHDRLKRAERQAAWAEMARQVAHEIKNPLTPMRMSAQLLLKARREGNPRADELVERLARTVVEQTEALDRIASDFRHFAGAPERVRESVGFDDLLEGYRESLVPIAGENVRLGFDPGAGDAQVAVDAGELRRVFLNLVANASEACGGRGQLHWTSSIEGDRAVVHLSDDGPGIPEDVRLRLFEPYFTTKSSGTGLGLAICRRVVEAHGGRITLASSRPGETVFRLELPVANVTGAGASLAGDKNGTQEDGGSEPNSPPT